MGLGAWGSATDTWVSISAAPFPSFGTSVGQLDITSPTVYLLILPQMPCLAIDQDFPSCCKVHCCCFATGLRNIPSFNDKTEFCAQRCLCNRQELDCSCFAGGEKV